MTARADIGGAGAEAPPFYVAGDTLELLVTVLDGADGAAVDITAVTSIRYAITKIGSGGDPVGPALVSKSLGAGIVITNGPLGLFTVTLAAGETGALGGSYRHECEVIDASARVSTVFFGRFVVTTQAIMPA